MTDTFYVIVVTVLAFLAAAVFRPLRQRDRAPDRADAADLAQTEHRIEEIERAARRDR